MEITSTKHVSVTVSGTGQVSCSPSMAVIKGSNVTISFTLQTSGYHFPTSGAVVPANPSAQFPNPSSTVSTTNATLLDINSVAGDFDYTVTVVADTGEQRFSVDPSIRNEG